MKTLMLLLASTSLAFAQTNLNIVALTGPVAQWTSCTARFPDGTVKSIYIGYLPGTVTKFLSGKTQLEALIAKQEAYIEAETKRLRRWKNEIPDRAYGEGTSAYNRITQYNRAMTALEESEDDLESTKKKLRALKETEKDKTSVRAVFANRHYAGVEMWQCVR